MIEAVLLDVDGVLTDGTFGWSSEGPQEYRRFSYRDVMGISLGIKRGLMFGLISGERNKLIARFANKMKIRYVATGCQNKVYAFQQFCKEYKFKAESVAFMGDDCNDVPLLQMVGLSAAPRSAHKSALQAARMVVPFDGGNGAVRALIDFILERQP